MPVAVMPELPKCDICRHLDLPRVNDATADSATTLGPWGYTCEMHAGYRVGIITHLVKAP